MTELTEEQKKKVDHLYRVKLWPIKKIAKSLHIGDKRVSAYLKGKPAKTTATKPSKDCCGCEGNRAKLLGKMIHGMSDQAERTSKEFIGAMIVSVLDIVNEIMESKKFNKKVWDKRCKNLLMKFGEAASSVFAVSLFAMPKAFKKAFINCIDVENPDYRKVKPSKK